MKAAVIFSIPLRMAKGFAWRWRSADHTQGSARNRAAGSFAIVRLNCCRQEGPDHVA